jgi:hypothetical protein
MREVNAVIESVALSDSEHGGLTAWVFLDYGDGGHQGFGGYALYLDKDCTHHTMLSVAGHFIWRCMEVGGVKEWSKLPGRTVRARLEDGWNGSILAIGHIVKNDWFDPKCDFAQLTK